MERVLAFSDRASKPSINLPTAWAQYKRGAFISFFAWKQNSRTSESLRWIAEPQRDTSNNVCFWRLSGASSQIPLDDFNPNRSLYDAAIDAWPVALRNSKAIFASRPAVARESTPTMSFPGVGFGEVTKDLTYSSWLDELTEPQRRFVEQPPEHSIRLRGPAGSGKTLALELKALHEAKRARDKGDESRILFVTHSWATAERVDDDLSKLSEWGPADSVGIEVYPLVSIAQVILPPERWDTSTACKRGQLQRQGVSAQPNFDYSIRALTRRLADVSRTGLACVSESC